MTRDRRFYISVEVDFFDHPKTMEVGEKVAFRHLKMLAWCHKHRTDGFIPKDAVGRNLTAASLAALVRAGLWEVCDGGWCVHDYLKHQQSRADLERASEAGKKGAAGRYANR